MISSLAPGSDAPIVGGDGRAVRRENDGRFLCVTAKFNSRFGV